MGISLYSSSYDIFRCAFYTRQYIYLETVRYGLHHKGCGRLNVCDRQLFTHIQCRLIIYDVDHIGNVVSQHSACDGAFIQHNLGCFIYHKCSRIHVWDRMGASHTNAYVNTSTSSSPITHSYLALCEMDPAPFAHLRKAMVQNCISENGFKPFA